MLTTSKPRGVLTASELSSFVGLVGKAENVGALILLWSFLDAIFELLLGDLL